jgi:hypothetical protein
VQPVPQTEWALHSASHEPVTANTLPAT